MRRPRVASTQPAFRTGKELTAGPKLPEANARLKHVSEPARGVKHVCDRNSLDGDCRERLVKETGIWVEFTGYGVDPSICMDEYNCSSVRNVLLHGEQCS